jgi:hypothetical protein
MLQSGLLGVGADAGKADEVALACPEIEHGEGRAVTAVDAMYLSCQNRLTTWCSGRFLDGFWDAEAGP